MVGFFFFFLCQGPHVCFKSFAVGQFFLRCFRMCIIVRLGFQFEVFAVSYAVFNHSGSSLAPSYATEGSLHPKPKPSETVEGSLR